MTSESSSSSIVLKNNLRVLIVDDMEFIHMPLNAYVKALRAEPLEASNGQEALEIMQNDKNIQLVIMDKEMPIMSGHEATRAMRAAGITVTIVAMTRHSDQATKKSFIDAGANYYYVKPMARDNIAKIMHYIDKKISKGKGCN